MKHVVLRQIDLRVGWVQLRRIERLRRRGCARERIQKKWQLERLFAWLHVERQRRHIHVTRLCMRLAAIALERGMLLQGAAYLRSLEESAAEPLGEALNDAVHAGRSG